MESLRTAYRALLDERCPSCRKALELSQVRLSRDEDDTYKTVYDCPHCGSTTQYAIVIQPPSALVKVRSAEGNRIKDNRKLLAQLDERGQSGSQQFDYVFYLATSLNIVYQNLNRLFLWSERFPEIFEQASGTALRDLDEEFENELVLGLGRDRRWIGLHTDIHNYLSSVYSHHKFVEDTIASIMESDESVDQIRTQYNANIKPLLGLRHYTQHRMIAPLHVRRNTESADRNVDILIALHNIRDYDYRDGFEYWFDDVDGKYIDVIDEGIQHYRSAGKHVIERIKAARENNKEDFNEIEDLEKEFPTIDELDSLSDFGRE